MNLIDLNDARHYMLEEFQKDISANTIYQGKYISDIDFEQYKLKLKEALKFGTPESLASEIHSLIKMTTRAKRRPSVNSHETLAESEFNKYYCRGVCRLAIESETSVIVYRAKDTLVHRPESDAKIGLEINPTELLLELENNILTDQAFGIPSGPNSGISIKVKRS